MAVAPSIIDTNVHIFEWPFRHLPAASPANFDVQFKKQQLEGAFVGSFESIFHRDIDGVNRRLTEACRQYGAVSKQGGGVWLPFGTVHLGLPDWREDLRRCIKQYHMDGIRLYPNYHQYRLDDETAMDFFRECDRSRMPVQIVMSLEDIRTQHPLVRVPPVDPDSLLPVLERFSRLPVMLLNAFRETPLGKLERVVQAGRVRLELATLERAAGLEQLLTVIPAERLCYGSNSPLYYPSAARLKLSTAEIGEVQRARIASRNALDWIGARATLHRQPR